jgi:AcrR family transcriptional regulator
MSPLEIGTQASPELPTAERVLIAAKGLFAQSGFENTTTASIARLARTSESQIVKHFGSKEGLLEEIFEDGWRHIAHSFAAIEYLPDPASKLQALVGSVLTTLEQDEQLKQLFLFEGRRIRREGHLVLITKGYLELIKIVDGLLADMQATGQLRSDLKVEAARSALIGMLEGMMRDKMLGQRANYPAAFAAEDIRKLFICLLESFSLKK